MLLAWSIIWSIVVLYCIQVITCKHYLYYAPNPQPIYIWPDPRCHPFAVRSQTFLVFLMWRNRIKCVECDFNLDRRVAYPRDICQKSICRQRKEILKIRPNILKLMGHQAIFCGLFVAKHIFKTLDWDWRNWIIHFKLKYWKSQNIYLSSEGLFLSFSHIV